jgi:hypothetical protein
VAAFHFRHYSSALNVSKSRYIEYRPQQRAHFISIKMASQLHVRYVQCSEIITVRRLRVTGVLLFSHFWSVCFCVASILLLQRGFNSFNANFSLSGSQVPLPLQPAAPPPLPLHGVSRGNQPGPCFPSIGSFCSSKTDHARHDPVIRSPTPRPLWSRFLQSHQRVRGRRCLGRGRYDDHGPPTLP